jgi:hypothetical protein
MNYLKDLKRLYMAARAVRMTPPVDDDFPEMMHKFDAEVRHIEQNYQFSHETGAESWCLITHLHNQIDFSKETFGPGARVEGITDHIKKELVEVQKNPTDLEEWIDLTLLSLDGAWRAGFTPENITNALSAKLKKNMNRKWPDWKDTDPNKAIGHIRD